MKLAVEIAKSAGVPVAVHTSTPEGMRRAALASVETIEHGDEGTPEVFKLMVEHHVALCPTLTAGAGPWPPADPDSPANQRKKAVLQGGARRRRHDHQRQRRRHVPARRRTRRELEAMVAYGMTHGRASRARRRRRRRCCRWRTRSAR